MTNPLDGIDDLISTCLLSPSQATRHEARKKIREKVAQANVILNGIVVDAGAERFKHLLEAEQQLGALLAAGVDNWEGYADAMASLKKE